MKKILFFAALVLGMASCQTEPEGLDVMVGGEQEVMLNVSLPESTRSASSAGFDFTNFESNDQYDLRFILEIAYNGTVVREVKTSETTSTTFPVRLVPERNYTFTVWADLVKQGSNGADLYYNILTEDANGNVPGLSNITFKEWTPNVEARDAYYGRRTLLDTESIAQIGTITLFRPFAKVRVVATDIADVTKFGITPNNANITYRVPMYTAFNAVNGTVAGSATTISSPIAYNIVADAYTENTNELTVFADYIFVPEGGNIQFDLNINQDGDLIKSNSFNTAIPVEVNKVTSIVGDVLTKGGNVSVTVDGTLGQKETINYVDNAESLQEIINNSEEGESVNITLGGDINLNDLLNAGILATRAQATAGLVIPANKTIVLDLKGYTISQSVDCSASYSMITNNGNLTITGEGTIEFTNTAEGGGSTWGTYTIENRGEGVLTIDNATIRHNGCVNGDVNRDTNIAIQNYQGKVVINDGNIVSTQFRSLRDFTAGGEIIINGGTFLGQVWMQGLGSGSSSLTINGGNFTPVVGYDGSSVYITNSSNIVNVAVNGGVFNTKIGCYDATKEGAKGCIVGGTFTTEAKENTNAALINDNYQFVADNDLWTIGRKADVAKIGEVGYTSLAKAVAAVNDGETITLVADEVFTENNYYDNGGWKDGLGYAGDKSFTIDLGGNTVSQNGALNDYLLWFKNVGSKANTITIKNGTLDAGTTAYCALCTASSHENELTINLEDITLTNNNSNGSTIKVRAGSTLNVKAGTKIIGKNSYLGIENWNATVNVFEGAKIYMNGTTSYNGCLIGVGGNGVINVYGGYGKGVSGGLIAMTSGGTINVSGGEWIANTDGTYANSNKSVLVAQSDKQYNAGAGNAVVNVTGGTFKGGYNCYGNAVGDAQINITGGNFNSNPASYVAEGFGATEDNGIWTVAKSYDITEEGYTILTAPGMFWFANEVNSGANYFEGKTIKLGADIDLNNAEWAPIGSASKDHGFMGNFDGNGKVIKNLNITNIALDADGYAYAGLFGVTEGIDKDNQNYIKNLTIENVNIKTTGHIVAAAIAYPYYTNLENIKVQGNVAIEGGDYTSGVLAYTRRCVDAKNIAIEANAGSVIEGAKTIGGVISDIQMNGGLVANYSNFKAENLTIKGTQCVGGISGIIGAQNLDGVIVKNVTIVSDDIRTGMISGSFDRHSVITNAVVENVTGADYYIGCLYSGTASDKSSVTINGDVYTYNNGWIINGCKIIADGVILNEAGEFIISNAAGMFWFANEVNVNNKNFSGKTVKLTENINLDNAAWTPIGQTGATQFMGTFDGNSKTISNLNIDATAQTGANYSSGLFGWLNAAKVKNVTINGAVVKGNHNVGVIAGYLETSGCTIEACNITNAVVEGHHATNDACGDKVGGIVGHAGNSGVVVKDCVISSSTISAGRDAGQVAGAAKTDNVIGCSANNVTVTANGECTGANVRNEVIGRVL